MAKLKTQISGVDRLSNVFEKVANAARKTQGVFGKVGTVGTKALNGVERATQPMSNAFNRLSDRVWNASQRAFGGFRRAGSSAFNALKKRMDDFQQNQQKGVDKMKQSWNSFGNVVKGVLLGMGTKQLMNWTLAGNAALEQYKIAYSSLFGGEEQGLKAVKEVQDLAAITPYQEKELLYAGKIAATTRGEFTRTLTAMGNLASAYGVNLRSAADAFRDSLGQSLESLEWRVGVSKKDVIEWLRANKELGKSFNVRGIVLDYDRAREALLRFIEEKYGTLMQRQSRTLLGLISTLKDNFVAFGRWVGEEAFYNVRNKLRTAIDQILSMRKSGELRRIGYEIGRTYNRVLTDIWDFFKKLSPAVQSFTNILASTGRVFEKTFGTKFQPMEIFERALNTMAVAVNGIFKLFEKVFSFVEKHWGIFEPFAVAIAAMIIAVKAFNGLFLGVIAAVKGFNIVSSLNPWVLAIGAISAAVYLLWKNWGKIKQVFIDSYEAFKTLFINPILEGFKIIEEKLQWFTTIKEKILKGWDALETIVPEKVRNFDLPTVTPLEQDAQSKALGNRTYNGDTFIIQAPDMKLVATSANPADANKLLYDYLASQIEKERTQGGDKDVEF